MSSPVYQIRSERGMWWDGEHWVASTKVAFLEPQLPCLLPTTNATRAPFASRGADPRINKEWRHMGKLIARAVHVGG